MNIEYIITFKFEKGIIKLYNPYLDDNFKIAFKMCNLLNVFTSIYFDEYNLSLIINLGNKKYKIKIDEKQNKEAINKILKIKNEIICDLKLYKTRLETKEEKILIIVGEENDDREFVITTNTALENGQYSDKYYNAILYYIKQVIKPKQEFCKFVEIQSYLNNVFKNVNFSRLEKHKLTDKEYFYEVEIEDLAKFLK